MDIKSHPTIVSAQRTRDGVLIEFDDGNAAIYPASLLAAVLSQAVRLEDWRNWRRGKNRGRVVVH
jgi:hypothetical protein